MKNLILSILFFCFAGTVNAACTINSFMKVGQSRVFNEYGGWKFDKFEEVCEKLKKADASIQVISYASVLSNRSIGWATLQVMDKKTSLATSDFNSMNIIVNPEASEDVADRLMVKAINNAANAWFGLDNALIVLSEEREIAKRFFKK